MASTQREDGAAPHDQYLRVLDHLPICVGFYAPDGTLLRANRSLQESLDHPEAGSWLRQRISEFVGDCAGAASPADRAACTRSLLVEYDQCHDQHYVLRGSSVGTRLFGEGGELLVTVTSTSASVPEIRDTLGLTQKEAEVARLLALGHSNRQISDALGMSPHTARTHTKRILRKLDAQSRAEVAGVLRAF